MSIEFLITAFIVALVPGTGVVYTVTTAILHGRAMGFAAAAGCTFGIVPAMLASIAGVAAILHTSALLFTIFKWLGVAYLLYLAWRTLQDSGSLEDDAEGTKNEKGTAWSVAWLGFLINILNPKLSAFFLALLPQFVDPAAPHATWHMLENGVIFMVVTFVVFALYSTLAAFARDAILRSARLLTWMRRTVALTFAGFSIRLALSER